MESSNEKKIYCRKCGSEMPQNADYCEACGAPVEYREMKYIKPRGSGNNFGKVIAVLFGGFFILVAVPILFGGGALMGVTDFFDQGGGYIGVDNVNFATSTQMIVAKEMDIVIDDYNTAPTWLWEPSIGDLVTIKIKAESNTGDNVFIGIVDASDAYAVLGSSAYDQITRFNLDGPRDRYPDIAYRYHAGEALNITPADLDIWVAEVSGNGEQTLTWNPELGQYWLVIMNEDGSASVDVDTGVSVKMPILGSIGRGLFVGGLVLLAVGVAIVYFGAIKPRN
ncbi:MAG: zinc-ribbon domain-containing protein [bacterium]